MIFIKTSGLQIHHGYTIPLLICVFIYNSEGTPNHVPKCKISAHCISAFPFVIRNFLCHTIESGSRDSCKTPPSRNFWDRGQGARHPWSCSSTSNGKGKPSHSNEALNHNPQKDHTLLKKDLGSKVHILQKNAAYQETFFKIIKEVFLI